ncbi:uncharacterized protein LOC134217030 [Armigeres subalbatus]|uniref:uncharacterized protein LOC134217030 n=1 Tax=Armigeres subalbatus TaxID=124917 RepID=UPI002ED27F25
MSKSLVKKALALVEEGLTDSKKSESTKDKKRKPDNSDIMPRHHKMVRYVGKRGHKKATDVLRRPETLTVVEARKRINNRKDNTEDNVRKLLLLSSAKIGEEAGAKLVKRAQTGRYVVKADEFLSKKDTSKSVFDEEDFRKFEEELFCTISKK